MPPENRKRRSKRKRVLDTSTWTEEQINAKELKERLNTPIAEMNLSVRVINALEEGDVILASDLMIQTYESLMAMKNFGEKTLTEVQEALKQLGITPPTWEKPIKQPKEGITKDVIKFW